jgi:hypothetical protein
VEKSNSWNFQKGQILTETKEILTGVVYNLADTLYHAAEALGSTNLRTILSSISLFLFKKANSEHKKAYDLGKAAHCLILQPELFFNDFAIWKLGHKNKENLTPWRKFQEENTDKTILTQEEFKAVGAMRDSVFAHPMARSILVSGEPEVSFFWTDEETQIRCKVRTDFFGRTKNKDIYITDLKTSSSKTGGGAASQKEFTKTCGNYGYHRQAAHYVDGVEATTGEAVKGFLFIVVETAPPLFSGSLSIIRSGYRKRKERQQRSIKKISTIPRHPPGREKPFSRLLFKNRNYQFAPLGIESRKHE